MNDTVATVPMAHIGGLIEPSFADAIMIITAAGELTEQKRRHWTTSLRQVARLLDKPLESSPPATARSAPISPSSTTCPPA